MKRPAMDPGPRERTLPVAPARPAVPVRPALPVLLAVPVLLAATLAGCASRGPLPFRPEPIPYADTLPIHEPAARSAVEAGTIFEEAVVREFLRPLEVRRWADEPLEALNVTRFDGVVNSAWFENRNGTRRLDPGKVYAGAPGAPPDVERVLTIVEGKSVGLSPGFTVEDARGNRYLFKFDPEGFLHLASSADVVTSRLLWAAGYHTPADHKVVFDSAWFRLSPEATIETREGERPMRREDVRDVLSLTDPTADGRWVTLASQFVPGTPKGPFHFRGLRRDDPNDHYLHEHRRELRGLRVLAAWLNHVDIRFANTLDSFVEPGYLRHHLIDFGASLGSGTIRPHQPREGEEYNYDFWPTWARLLTFGFFRMGWEGREPALIHPALGWMPVESFDPEDWKPNWPNGAFTNMTTRDAYWGAKLVGSFTEEQLAAAVRAAALPDSAAADTLLDILRFRQRATLSHWYGRVTPLEEPELVEGDLRFRDLGIEHGLWTGARTRYAWRLEGPAVERTREGEHPAVAGSARQLLPLSLAPPGRRLEGREALARLEVVARRPGASGRKALVYLLWRSSEGRWEVVGLEH